MRASTFLGEFEYLTRLECPDGTKPHIQRLPLRERGAYGDMVNGYRLRCIYMNRETQVYIDPRHEHVELEPVTGFGFSRPPDRARLFWLDGGQ